ncbi:MAG TPA: IPT/TIG domain-containing protein [Thermoanaerobaculia bacterium]|nr:IPT/TIG domain-containing protein [Thermoanaerobaculia bacterium]
MPRRFVVILFVFLSLPLFAYTIAPASGPTTGGTEVTITGDLPELAYGVLFGSSSALTQRIDAHTLLAITPAHLPGTVEVEIFSLGRILTTDLKFTFVGDVPSDLERVLLPIFINPVKGQFGSEFVTAFAVQLVRGNSAKIHGLRFRCTFICPPIPVDDLAVLLTPQGPRAEVGITPGNILGGDLVTNGNPGRFLYLPRSEVANVAMNLRVFDRSRAAQNYGTEIPIVASSRFVDGEDLTLLNVPTDSRFRSTLRIYGTASGSVRIRLQPDKGAPLDATATLTAGTNLYEPAVATFTDFPANAGLVTVTIRRLDGDAQLWAFVSTTNNDTQLITTVTPQP